MNFKVGDEFQILLNGKWEHAKVHALNQDGYAVVLELADGQFLSLTEISDEVSMLPRFDDDRLIEELAKAREQEKEFQDHREKLRVLESKSDAGEALQAALRDAHDFEAVFIIAVRKDGSQYIRSNSCSQMQKSFMLAALQAWVLGWFRFSEN